MKAAQQQAEAARSEADASADSIRAQAAADAQAKAVSQKGSCAMQTVKGPARVVGGCCAAFSWSELLPVAPTTHFYSTMPLHATGHRAVRPAPAAV